MSLAAYRYTAAVMPVLTAGQVRVMVALADHHNAHTGACYPSIARIAEMTGLEARYVRRVLVALEDGGIIAGEHRPGRVTLWRMPIGEYIATASYPQPRAPAPYPTGVRPGRPGPTTQGAQALPPRAPRPHESVIEPGKKTARARAIWQAARDEAREG